MTADEVQGQIREIMGMCAMLTRSTQALKADMDVIITRCEGVRKGLDELASANPDNPKFTEAAEQVTALVNNLRATVGAPPVAERLH